MSLKEVGRRRKEEGNSNHLVKCEEKGGDRHKAREAGASGNFYSKGGWRHMARAVSEERLELKAHAKLGLGFASAAYFCRAKEAAGPGYLSVPTRAGSASNSHPSLWGGLLSQVSLPDKWRQEGHFWKTSGLFLSFLQLIPFPEPCTNAYLAPHSLCKIKVSCLLISWELLGGGKGRKKGLSEQGWIAITLMGCQKSAGSRVRAANPPLVFCPRHCLGSVVAH